jgi:hypothetical protein
MKANLLILFVFVFSLVTAQKAEIGNKFYKIEVDRSDGTFSGISKEDGIVMFKDARFRIDPGIREWKRPEYNYECEKILPVDTEFGRAKMLRVWYLPQKSYDPDRFLEFIVPEDRPFLIVKWGIRNPFEYEVRVRNAEVLQGGVLLAGQKPVDPKSLRGGAGAEPNFIEDTLGMTAFNSAMLTYVDEISGKRRTIVAGGLKYREYARTVISEFKKNEKKGDMLLLTLSVFDPQGKRIPPGEAWTSDDSYYIDFSTSDPFDALELYGLSLAKANDAHPNRYNFPTLCGWMVSTKSLGEGKPINNSPGLVEQMRIAKKHGLNRYTTLAVRLEPDYYCYNDQGNTQQGWWDDEHWAKYGSLKPPYKTFAQFCKAVNDLGGKVFTYFQASLPSNDFAVAHPEWMLNDDISLLHIDHPHHRPLVRYDYTNPDFQNYVLKMWRRLKRDGVEGIKFDYPETAWARNGGFDDKSYTTTSAYREVFKLCREGLGDSAYIHERIIGNKVHESVPRLDCTAGIVDLQRVWSDASHFEPEMASRIGLRWYKQGKVFRYYPDGKSFYYKGKALSQKDRRTMLTLIGLLSGRIELGTSIGSMTDEMFYDLTRMFPTLPNGQAFRPADMMLGHKHPRVYVYKVSDSKSVVILYNTDTAKPQTASAPLSGDMVTTGSLGLDASKKYYVFDFWNRKPMGEINGSGELSKKLQPGEALVFSLTGIKDEPQVLGTDRNVMCGMFEISNEKWDEASRTFTFDANVTEGEEMSVFVRLPEELGPDKIKVQAVNAKVRYFVKDDVIVVKLLNKKENVISNVTLEF